MLLLVAAVIASEPQVAQRPTAATAQARAIVRVVSAVRLSFDRPSGEGVPPVRQTKIRTADSRLQPARLIEFE